MPPGAGDGSRFDTGRQDVTDIALVDDQLAGYVEAMRRAYGEVESARTIDEVKDIRDRAEAARQYARAAGYSREITNMCAEIKLRAERKAGTLLAEMPKNPGARNLGADSMSAPELPPTLEDIGVSQKQSSRWQQTAAVPEDVFEDYIQSVRDDETGTHDLITSSGIRQHAERLKRLRDSLADEERRNPEKPIAELLELQRALRAAVSKLRALKDAGQDLNAVSLAQRITDLCREMEELLCL